MSGDMVSFVDQELAGAAALVDRSNAAIRAAGPIANALQLIEGHIPCFPADAGLSARETAATLASALRAGRPA
jgi:hypothetical protein